jgi:hypothetical protein
MIYEARLLKKSRLIFKYEPMHPPKPISSSLQQILSTADLYAPATYLAYTMVGDGKNEPYDFVYLYYDPKVEDAFFVRGICYFLCYMLLL